MMKHMDRRVMLDGGGKQYATFDVLIKNAMADNSLCALAEKMARMKTKLMSISTVDATMSNKVRLTGINKHV
jgi:hypothetical protein